MELIEYFVLSFGLISGLLIQCLLMIFRLPTLILFHPICHPHLIFSWSCEACQFYLLENIYVWKLGFIFLFLFCGNHTYLTVWQRKKICYVWNIWVKFILKISLYLWQWSNYLHLSIRQYLHSFYPTHKINYTSSIL